MVKSLLVLINLGFLAALNFLFLQNIEVNNNLPNQLAPGESVEVELTISKGSVSGFAKLQLNVGNGLAVENIESPGASFTFNDQKAKFIWMSLPEDKIVTVRYRLTALPDARGPQKVDGSFSYIDDNQRLVHELPAKFVQTEGDAVAKSENGSANTSQAFASIHRTVGPTSRGRYKVTLSIHKTDLSGFAKIEEHISRDYTAAAMETNDAVFNIVDNKIKFVWFDIPASNDITVSYELIPVTEGATSDFEIDGEFSFLVNNETQSVKIADFTEEMLTDETTDQPVEPTVDEPVADKTEETEEPEESPTVVEVEPSETWKETALSEEQEDSEEEEEEEKVALDEEKQEPTTDVTEREPAVANTPETAITFRVQITAAHKLVDAQYFKSQHKFEEEYFVENHEGWVKYTTGRFEIYRAASDHRKALNQRYDFPGPFVTAYNDGERITVQEALMIANQKWVP